MAAKKKPRGNIVGQRPIGAVGLTGPRPGARGIYDPLAPPTQDIPSPTVKPGQLIASAPGQHRLPGFLPYKPPVNPPPGTYDPTLDANQRATQRGLSDLTTDTAKQSQRGLSDYLLAVDAARRQQTEGGADLAQKQAREQQDFATGAGQLDQGYQRNLSDLLTQRTQAGQDFGTGNQRRTADYQTATDNLGRRYSILGDSQTQQTRAAGADEGGALAQALAKRQANQQLDQQPLTTDYTRSQADAAQAYGRFTDQSAQGEQRLGQDYGQSKTSAQQAHDRFLQDAYVAGGRLNDSSSRTLSDLALNHQRSGEDLASILARGKREAGAFTLDTNRQKWYESKGLYTPPNAPTNEVGRGTATVQIVKGPGGQPMALHPDGTLEPVNKKTGFNTIGRKPRSRGLSAVFGG